MDTSETRKSGLISEVSLAFPSEKRKYNSDNNKKDRKKKKGKSRENVTQRRTLQLNTMIDKTTTVLYTKKEKCLPVLRGFH